MNIVNSLEHRMDRWAWGWLTRRLAARREPVEVVAILRRECDDNTMIMARGRVMVPNAFILEVSADSHRRLSAQQTPLERQLRVAVCAHAATRSYLFAGPVTVRLETGPDAGAERYRIRSRIAPASVLHPRPGL